MYVCIYICMYTMSTFTKTPWWSFQVSNRADSGRQEAELHRGKLLRQLRLDLETWTEGSDVEDL